MVNSRILYFVFSSALILSVICNEIENSDDEEKIEKILRVQLEENEKKIVTMSDGEMFVNFEFTGIGAIGDCKVVRRRRMALGMLKYDVRIGLSEPEGWGMGGALCVELGFYVDISQESRCNSKIKV